MSDTTFTLSCCSQPHSAGSDIFLPHCPATTVDAHPGQAEPLGSVWFRETAELKGYQGDGVGQGVIPKSHFPT